MTLHQFLTILNARKALIVFTFLLTVSLSGVITYFMPKTYIAESSVVVNLKGVDLVTGEKVLLELQTQSNVISSLKVAMRVVDILELASMPHYVESFHQSNGGRGDIRTFIGKELKKKMRVIANPGNKVIRIVFESNSPEFAAAVANAYTKAYIDVSLELMIEPSKRATEWFKEQVLELRKELAQRQSELIEFQKTTGIIDADGKLDFESSQLSQVNNQLFEAKSELFIINAQLTEIHPDGSNFTEVVRDKVVDDVRASLLKAESDFSRLTGVSKNHPDYIKLSSKVLSLRKTLKSSVHNAYKQLVSKQTTLKKRVARLESSIIELKDLVIAKNEILNALNVIKNKVSESELSLEMAVKRLNKISLEGRSSESDISVLTKASAPTDHSKPKFIINIILGVFFGLILAFGFAMLLELINRKVRTEDDVTVSIGLPLLGEIKNATSRF